MSEIKSYINSNNGDFIIEMDGNYTIHFHDNSSSVKISHDQFIHMKGFVPIKYNKLFHRKRKSYGKTLKGGIKDVKYIRTHIPTLSDIRNIILEDLC